MKQNLKSIILSKVKDDLLNIETALCENLNPCLTLVSDIAGHLLFSGGKRLRPLLMVLSSRLCGYRGGDEIKFSTIFEYLHAATLLHDDVVDGANMRRGKPSAHFKWNVSEVVLTGDFLLARSLSIASMTKIPELIEIIAKITEDMSQGEIEQLDRIGDINLTEKEYMEVIRRKTAVLIQGACKSGAILAFGRDMGSFSGMVHDAASDFGRDDSSVSFHLSTNDLNSNLKSDPWEKEKALNNYGYHLGMAFQMADDLLDYTADAESMGKNPGTDIREGKLTLPLIITLAKAEKQDRARIEKIIKASSFSNKEFIDLTAMLYKYKGIEYTESKAHNHVEKAKASLDIFKQSKSKDVMMMLADYAVARKV